LRIIYTYDVLGRRTQKQVQVLASLNDPLQTFTRKYVYDGAEILLEYDAANNVLARYTHSTLATDDVLSASVTNSGVTAKLAQSAQSYFYLKDQLGTVTDISDSSGNKLQHQVYGPRPGPWTAEPNLCVGAERSPVFVS
jgi:hypothetical protein